MSHVLPSPAQLLEIAYLYYPHRVEYDRTSEPSPELRRLREAATHAWEQTTSWDQLLARLRLALPGFWISDEMIPRLGGAYGCRVYPPEYSHYGLPESLTAVGMVSYLAPVYLVYSSFQQCDPQDVQRDLPPVLSYHPEGEIALYARTLAETIEAVFGYSPLPLDIAFMPVPDIQVGDLRYGTARLIDVLFTDDRR